DVGTIIKQQDLLTEIVQSSESLGLLSQLDIERKALRARIEALKGRIVSLSEMRVRMDSQSGKFKSGVIQKLGYQIGEANAALLEWQAIRKERNSNLERIKPLVEKGVLPATQLDTAEALLEQAVQEFEQARQVLSRLKQELASAQQGIYLDQGRNDVHYSDQRIDEINISELDLNSQIAEAVARLESVEESYQQEIKRSVERGVATIHSPINGTVWRRLVTEQEPVNRGQELIKLLDCNTLVAEVAIPEGYADYVEIGSEVGVRLQGSVDRVSGILQDVRGPRTVSLNVEYVATPPELKRNQVLVTIALSIENFQTRNRPFCGVGRRAEIYIPRRIEPVLGTIKRFLGLP
ncbi:MAG: HlyD family efflux transporter periplasmic adaptor subunit, partial [Saprospiraceae bacterium]|nr:HlyD family efflux transporter periplasmic adaptor subunit [Saprospiraceae bacterium]